MTGHRRALLLPVLAVLAATSLSGCRDTPSASGQQGFVSGNGEVRILATKDRNRPDEVKGRTLDGAAADLADLRGKVVVMPVWGSWCGPCRAEAPMLSQAARQLRPRGVEFLGINSRDTSVENAQAFVRTFDVSYPSIYDPSGSLLLAFHSGATPSSIPSFMFIDREGRVAAAVLGEITRTTLDEVVEEIS